MSPAIAAPIIALAAYRLWRLLALDELTRPLRARLFRTGPEVTQDPRFGSALYWLRCPWCSGTWLSALATLAADLLVDGGLEAPVLAGAAAAAMTGILGAHDPSAFSE